MNKTKRIVQLALFVLTLYYLSPNTLLASENEIAADAEQIIAFFPFITSDRETPRWGAEKISDILRNRLGDLRYAIVPDDEAVIRALNRSGISPTEKIQQSLLRKFESITGAQTGVLGAVSIKNEAFYLKIRVFSLDRPERGKTYRFKGELEEFPVTLQEVTAQIARACKLPLTEADKESFLRPLDFEYKDLEALADTELKLENGYFDVAYEIVRNVLESHPRFVEAVLLAGKILYRQRETSQAVRLLREGIERNPRSQAIALKLGQIQYGIGQTEPAKELFERVLVDQPKNPAALYYISQIYLKKGLYELALESAQKGLRYSADQDAFYLLLGRIYKNKGNYPFAMEMVKRAIKINPKNSDAKQEKGILLAFMGNYNQATEIYSDAMQAAEIDTSSIPSIAVVKNFSSSNDDVRLMTPVEDYLSRISEDPENVAAYNALGAAYEQEKEWDKAEKAYKKAIEKNPSFQPAYYNLAVNLAYQGKVEESEETFLKALTLNPQHTVSYVHLGELYWNNNNKKKALAIWEEGLKENPDDKTIARKVVHAYARQNKWKNVIRTIENSGQEEGDQGDASLRIGRIYLQYGKDKKALAYFKKGLKQSPHNMAIHKELAIYYDFYRNDIEKAIEYYESYLGKERDLEKKNQVKERISVLKSQLAQAN